VLLTNIATFVLLLVLLTVVPMLPGMIMGRLLKAEARYARVAHGSLAPGSLVQGTVQS
jgi:hypothetical protein